MIFLLLMFLLLLSGQIWKDFLIYKSRGYAQPDDENDSRLITGPSDASAHHQVDRFKKRKD